MEDAWDTIFIVDQNFERAYQLYSLLDKITCDSNLRILQDSATTIANFEEMLKIQERGNLKVVDRGEIQSQSYLFLIYYDLPDKQVINLSKKVTKLVK